MQSPRFSRRVAIAALLVLAIVGTAATKYAAETDLRFVGPFFTTPMSFDSTNGGQVGGETRTYLAGATLVVGDVVYISGDNAVNKSTTLADHEKVAGVVIGGRSTAMRAKLDSTDLGTTAAVVNRPVIVLRFGRAWIRTGAVTGLGGDTVRAGIRCKPSTGTSGRVSPATTAFTIAAGAVAVTSSAANGAIVSGDGLTRIFCTGVKLAVPGQALLAEINAK